MTSLRSFQAFAALPSVFGCTDDMCYVDALVVAAVDGPITAVEDGDDNDDVAALQEESWAKPSFLLEVLCSITCWT